MNQPTRCDRLIQIRAPEFLTKALDRAADGRLCASADVDQQRSSFAAGSLSWPELKTLPLLIRHDTSKAAGRILDLDYRPDGNLFIRALVTDAEARQMPAFSIAATVIESEIRNADSPSGFHATIRKAVINEISLTP